MQQRLERQERRRCVTCGSVHRRAFVSWQPLHHARSVGKMTLWGRPRMLRPMLCGWAVTVHVPSGSHAHAGASFGIGPPSQSSHDSCTHTFRAPLPLPAPFSGAATVTSTCGMVNALVVCRCTSTTTSVCTLECEWLFLPDDMVLRGQA